MSRLCFHSQTGSMVLLSNGNRTAQRSHPQQEFNNGLVMSSEPLRDNELFEIRIDKKIQMWSGSVEIGVTASDPATLQFPSSATNLQENAWIMSGSSVLRDGRSLVDEYGTDLDQLAEGDRLGVMRTSSGDLQFFVNGVCQGVAATGVPPTVYAVVDIYGKCAQVSVVDGTESRLLANAISNENLASSSSHPQASTPDDRLRFHERHGSLVVLSNGNRTAERTRPSDEFNNGVVVTHRPLRDDELFEIRIDELVNKWSGSIEMGVTTHSPDTLRFPATMTNLKSGTIMMSGCGILTNGKGSRREYGSFNLDELREGDRIGLVRTSAGELRYFINGLDQGIAATDVPPVVYGVVDLYGMTVKVTIAEQGSVTAEESVPGPLSEATNDVLDAPSPDPEKLLFHPRCGSHAAVICGGRSAHRPNALDDFNDAVVLTNRPLRPNELFEVVLERLVVKWAGSIEIGVTTHAPHQLSFPSTMTNIRSGTWMMTGNGIMYNGTTVVDEYGQNLDRLKVGDRIGVLRTSAGTLHFFVNGVDQGPAAASVPEKVYGVVDLYGQAAQASIMDHSDAGSVCTSSSSSVTLGSDLRLHHLHGRNARILNQGMTAVRPNAQGEFNDAIVMSNRPLRDGELFEVVIEKMVDRWSGSIEAGVTLIPPEELNFPSTMTDIDHDTWMLSGSAIMQDGSTVRNGYRCDLDQLRVGTRIGMMRHADGSLHYYVNGEDQGVACTYVPPSVYAVVDLYGQCAQVSVVRSGRGAPSSAASSPSSPQSSQVNAPVSAIGNEVTHCFSPCCGKNIVLRSNNTAAFRSRGFAHGLLFGGSALEADELFEIQVEQLNHTWAGSLCIGVTTFAPSEGSLPASVFDVTSSGSTWVATGSQIRRNGILLKDNYGPSLNRLSVGDRVGVCRSADGTMHVYINGEDLGVAATNLAKKVYAVVDVHGCIEAVSICSSSWPQSAANKSAANSLDQEVACKEAFCKERISQEFHENHGRNIQLLNGNLTARRVASYNQGLVVSSKPLSRDQLFQVQLDHLDPRWTSSLQIGVIGQSPEKLHFPVSALGLRKSSWIVCGECVFQNGIKAKCRYGPNLDSLQVHHLVGVAVDMDSQLHLYINGVDQGVAAKDIPLCCYAVVDLYGQTDQVTIVEPDECQHRDSGRDRREKADIDNGVKEKPSEKPPQSSEQQPPGVKNCEYLNACTRFKSLLGLPEGYFADSCTCFCDGCHKVRGDEPYYRKGDPPKDYAVPFGWCRFKLRLPPKLEAMGVQDKWHVAFHGTRVGAVRRIVDCGQLIPAAEMGLGPFAKEMSQRGKKQDFEVSHIFFSPTLKYAGRSAFAPRKEFQDPKTHQVLQARVAFQVYVRPGSYTCGPQRVGAREPIDVHFSNNDLEWHTKERGATALHSLLVRLEGL